MIIGMIYMGYTPFVISTRNNAAAVAHLLTHTKARHIYLSGDHTIQSLGKAALNELDERSRPTVYGMPLFADLYGGLIGPGSVTEEKFEPFKADPDAPVFIMHSSGLFITPHRVSIDHSVELILSTRRFNGISEAHYLEPTHDSFIDIRYMCAIIT